MLVSAFACIQWTLVSGHKQIVARPTVVPDGCHVELTNEYQRALFAGDKGRCSELRRQWKAGTFGRKHAVLSDAARAARAENARKAREARQANKAAAEEALRRRIAAYSARSKITGGPSGKTAKLDHCK